MTVTDVAGKTISIPVHAYTKVLDAPQGIVSAIVSVSGNRDEGGDVVLPGAGQHSLSVVPKPKGVWSHDWSTPVAKALKAEEIAPGDARLPGELLTAGFGGFWVEAQFNVETSTGKDALSNVKFFGDEQEWSIGYTVPPGGAFTNTADESTAAMLGALPAQTKDAVAEGLPTRFIAQYVIWEFSPVLFGMNRMTGTTGGKDLLDAVARGFEKIAVHLDAVPVERIEILEPKAAPALSEVQEDRIKDAEEALGYLVADVDLDTKAGRAIARRNRDRLRRMRDALNELLEEADPEGDDGKGHVADHAVLAKAYEAWKGVTIEADSTEALADYMMELGRTIGAVSDEEWDAYQAAKADDDVEEDGYEPTGDEKDHEFRPDADHPQRCADCGGGQRRPWHKPSKDSDDDDPKGLPLDLMFEVERARLDLA